MKASRSVLNAISLITVMATRQGQEAVVIDGETFHTGFPSDLTVEGMAFDLVEVEDTGDDACLGHYMKRELRGTGEPHDRSD